MRKVNRSFLITGLFRSGTKFLAENMNRSAVWTVRHEGVRKGMAPQKYAEKIQRVFDRNNYGEVSYYLQFVIPKLRLWRRGIVLRRPSDVWLSITTYRAATFGAERAVATLDADLRKMKRGVPHLLALAKSPKYAVIDFERMTTDAAYLGRIFRHFGVADVAVTEEMVRSKINASPESPQRKTWADFSPEAKAAIDKLDALYDAEFPNIPEQTWADT